MKRTLAFLIYALGLTSLASAAPLSSDQFTQAFAKALRSAQPTLSIAVKRDLELIIKEPDGKESTVLLNNAFTRYLQDPNQINEVFRVYIASFVETRTKPKGIDRTRIVPIIKNRAWLAGIREAAKRQGGKEIVYEELNDQLIVAYAEDTQHNINYLSPEDLTKLGVSHGQLRSVATANLQKLVPKLEIKRGAIMSMIVAGGDYEASFLLFNDLWNSLVKTGGEIVVAIPSRDVLVFTSSQNKEGLTKMRELASKLAKESAYTITDILFVYRNGQFTRFE